MNEVSHYMFSRHTDSKKIEFQVRVPVPVLELEFSQFQVPVFTLELELETRFFSSLVYGSLTLACE